MKLLVFMIMVFLINGIYAFCEEGQIDVNNASLKELDGIYGVGPATAQNIIDARPYDSIDNLINAKGIGEVKLSQIKDQGLACVEEQKTEDISNEEINKDDSLNVSVVVKDSNSNLNGEVTKITGSAIQETPKPPPVINLNAKNIKSENTTQSGSKTIYYLAGFAILLGSLFLIKSRKRKTEFDE